MKSNGFKSYIQEVDQNCMTRNNMVKSKDKIDEAPSEDLDRYLLPGEVAIANARKVIKHRAPGKNFVEECGTLVCTNFRIMFITSNLEPLKLKHPRNKLLGDNDIALGNVESLFVEYQNRKRKKLMVTSKLKDQIKHVEIHCKNFRMVTFHFAETDISKKIGVINAILHHAYPSTVSLAFAFDYNPPDVNLEEVCSVALYRTSRDWEDLILRFRLDERWRVCNVNRHFTTSNTMSEYFIVPYAVSDAKLKEAVNQYINNRLPIWSWTHANGCSMIRSSEIRVESELTEVERDLHEAIRKSDIRSRPLKVIEVGKTCPTRFQIDQSFTKVKALCMPATKDEYNEKDSEWFSSLHATKWLHHVNTLLSAASKVARTLAAGTHNVLVREPSGADVTAALTSLVQVMSDDGCRTLHGFQQLIQREWVIGGFPFLHRTGLLTQPRRNNVVNSTASDVEASQQSPIFTLFVDCVWQLINQHPCSFQFSSVFLTELHDAIYRPIFDTFLFNNERQRARALRQSDRGARDPNWQTLPVWAWSLQYDEHDLRLFNNPLYRFRKSGLRDLYSSSRDPFSALPLPALLPMTGSQDSLFHETSFASVDKLSADSWSDLRSVDGLAADRLTPADSSSADGDIDGKSAENRSSYPDQLDQAVSENTSLQLHYNSKTGMIQMPPDQTGYNSLDTGAGTLKKKHKFHLRAKFRRHPTESVEMTSHCEHGDVIDTFEVSATQLPVTAGAGHLPLGGAMRDGCLLPSIGVSNMRIWRACYMRWIPYNPMIGGGPCAVLIQQSVLLDQICGLHRKLSSLKKQLEEIKDSSTSPNDITINSSTSDAEDKITSEMFFMSTSLDAHDFLSGYFPYSSVSVLSTKRTILGPF